MDVVKLFVSEELVSNYLELVITYGVAGGFAIATVLTLLGMIIYKTLGFLNNIK